MIRKRRGYRKFCTKSQKGRDERAGDREREKAVGKRAAELQRAEKKKRPLIWRRWSFWIRSGVKKKTNRV